MPQKVAIVRNTLGANPGDTTDFTSSGFGTVVAAIVILGDANATNNPANNAMLSIGFWDGTNQRCAAMWAQDNQPTINNTRRMDDDLIAIALNTAASTSEWTASAITNGIRLTLSVDNTSVARFATVILIGGTGVSGKCGTFTPHATVDTAATSESLGFAPKLGFLVTNGHTSADAHTDSAILSFGVFGEGITQRCAMFSSVDAVADTTANQYVASNRATGQVSGGALVWAGEVTALGADDFTVTTRTAGSGGDVCFYLALGGADLEYTLGTLTTPTSPGTADLVTALGGLAGLLAVATTADALDSVETASDAEGWSVGLADGTNQYTHSFVDEDAAATANAASWATTTKTVDLKDSAAGTPADVAVATATFAAGTATLDYTTAPAAARLGFWVAFGDGGASALPQVDSITGNADGDEITFAYSEDVVVGSGGSGGHTIDCPTGAITLSSPSVSGNEITWTTSRTVYAGESLLADYAQPTDGIEADDDGADVASFNDEDVTNNSTQDSLSGNASPVAANTRTLQLTSVLPTPAWASDDEDVMTVSGSGLVTLQVASGGVATITDGAGTEDVEFLARVATWSTGGADWTGTGVGATIELPVTLTGYGDGAAVGTYPDVFPSVVTPVGVTFDGITGTEPNYTANFTVTDADGPWTAIVNGVEVDLTAAAGARRRRLIICGRR